MRSSHRALTEITIENATLAQLLRHVASSSDSSSTRKRVDRVGRRVSSVSDPRRVLSSGMHKILWWRQRVGQLSVGTYKPVYTCLPSILSSPFLFRSRSYLLVALSRYSLSLSLCDFLSLSPSPSFSLPLAAADPEAGERAGRYVHFYALIYAHAYTKNNPVSKLKDNKRSAVLQAPFLLDRSLSTSRSYRACLFPPGDLIIYYSAQSSATPKGARALFCTLTRIINN